jgi:trans-AT polyketide synthase/acyltransferase/oxidoreductase domain-containing protein
MNCGVGISPSNGDVREVGTRGSNHGYHISPESLGSGEFRSDYGIKYAYLAGAMYKGIASAELVIAMGQAGLMAYLGTGGLSFERIEADIRAIQSQLKPGQAYGMNLLHHLDDPGIEERTVDLYMKYDIRRVEAAAFMRITPSLVRYRLMGIARNGSGEIESPRRILAKVSRPEVAAAFMSPAPPEIVQRLVESGKLTRAEGELGSLVPMATEICVEADSGGHTDQGVAYALMPAMFALRSEFESKGRYSRSIKIGAAGGIGTPEAAAAAFVMGADFVLTGSINQCTVEAGTSDAVKDLLQEINVQDTAYAPAGDMFELGAKIQVVKKGVFFPARANKLYELYQRHNSLEEIDLATRTQIQERYFKCSFNDVWEEIRSYYRTAHPGKVQDMENNPKQKMASIFKWYFALTSKLAQQGDAGRKIDYQIHCGPALGAFNQRVKGTRLESWRNRHVVDLAEYIMRETALLMSRRFAQFTHRGSSERMLSPEAGILERRP